MPRKPPARKRGRPEKRPVKTPAKAASKQRRKRPWRNTMARVVHGHAALFGFGVVALSLLFGALTFQPTPHTGGDNAAYITLARSLLERFSYLELYDPAEPPHTQYPPAFPAILAVALAAGLQPWVQLKILITLFGAAAVGFSFLWIRRRGRPLLALGTATLLAIGPGVLTEMHWILSDVPFWMFTIAALWAFERLPPSARGRFAIAVGATLLAYFTRSAGLPLVVAALAWLALRQRWSQLAGLAGVMLPLALLWWLRSRTPDGADYLGQFLSVNPYDPALGRIGVLDLPARMADNAVKYARFHLPILLTGRASGWMLAPSVIVFALAAGGWLTRMRRPGVAELFLPLYLGLLLAWPAVWSGERFLLPALPLILCYAGDVIVRIGERFEERAGFFGGAAAVALAALIAVPTLRDAVAYGSQCTAAYRLGERYPCLPSAQWREFFMIAESTRETLPADAIVISRKPRLFYVLSGHPSRIFPFTDDPAAFFAFADTSRSRHLVFDFLDRPTQAYVRPVLLRRPEAFCLLYGGQAGTTVFGILPGAAAMPDIGTTADSPSFAPCGDEYWRSTAARDALLGAGGR